MFHQLFLKILVQAPSELKQVNIGYSLQSFKSCSTRVCGLLKAYSFPRLILNETENQNPQTMTARLIKTSRKQNEVNVSIAAKTYKLFQTNKSITSIQIGQLCTLTIFCRNFKIFSDSLDGISPQQFFITMVDQNECNYKFIVLLG